MKTICFYFQIHQPFRLKRYRFFDIGADHYYYDDFNNENKLTEIARKSYIPANDLIYDMIKKSNGQFKVAFSISGVALDQLEMHAPEVIDSFKKLANTGCVEFLAETNAHSLASIKDEEEFKLQIEKHTKRIKRLFGQTPTVFRNTELIYSDEIGEMLSSFGFKTVITEGAKHILGWKSPNYIYSCATAPKLKLLLKNNKLSDDITFRFSDTSWSEYPLKADTFIDWINKIPTSEQIVNLFMNYETLGNTQPASTGIFDFFKALPEFAAQKDITFSTPSELSEKLEPVETLSVPYTISWTDEEKDLSAWLGNELQNNAFEKLYSIAEKVHMVKDRRIQQDWQYLQTSDHFFYMSTKQNSTGNCHQVFSPYDSPFSAFTNYMNVLSDFIDRVNAQFPDNIDNEELNSLVTTINNQDKDIAKLEDEIKKLKAVKTTNITNTKK